MNKLIAISLAVCFPFYILAKSFTVAAEAVHDSRLYALGMFVESFKFHWEEHDLSVKDYIKSIKGFWNDEIPN